MPYGRPAVYPTRKRLVPRAVHFVTAADFWMRRLYLEVAGEKTSWRGPFDKLSEARKTIMETIRRARTVRKGGPDSGRRDDRRFRRYLLVW
jgi:hypothetical protein